jgi:hypothetical protein
MASPGSQDKFLENGHFSVEVKGGDTDPDVDPIDIGWDTLVAGENRVAGPDFLGEVVLRGPMAAARRAFSEWVNASARGNQPLRTVTVTVFHGSRLIDQVVFEDCLVSRYVFPHIGQAPGCPAPLLEEVRFVYRRRRRLTES